MRFYFSKRHAAALEAGRLTVSLKNNLRTSLLRILEKFSDVDFNDGNYTFYQSLEELKTFYGTEEIKAYKETVDFKGLILKGYPTKVLDGIETFFEHIDGQSVVKCERELNHVFELHNSPWRIINKAVYLIDSEYMHTEITSKLLKLLNENSLAGIQQEFQLAVEKLMDGNSNDAVLYSTKSIESMLKVLLNIDEHKTLSVLLKDLKHRKIVPTYYDSFFENFEKITLAASKERNQPGSGHGQGNQITKIPMPLAEFSVNLASVINLFLSKLWIENQKSDNSELDFFDEIPF